MCEEFSLAAAKAALRQRMRRQRLLLSPSQVESMSRPIVEYLDAGMQRAGFKVLMAYAPFRNEVDISPLLKSWRQKGLTLVLPVTEWETQSLLPVAVDRYPEDLVVGRYGLCEPSREAAREVWPVEDIDVVLVPGLAFDVHGYRLGYGDGFYDRFLRDLTSRTLTIGVAFDFQIVDTVFAESHDVPVNQVVTERRIIIPSRRRI